MEMKLTHNGTGAPDQGQLGIVRYFTLTRHHYSALKSQCEMVTGEMRHDHKLIVHHVPEARPFSGVKKKKKYINKIK